MRLSAQSVTTGSRWRPAVGQPITLRVVVRTSLGTVDLNWAVEARG